MRIYNSGRPGRAVHDLRMTLVSMHESAEWKGTIGRTPDADLFDWARKFVALIALVMPQADATMIRPPDEIQAKPPDWARETEARDRLADDLMRERDAAEEKADELAEKIAAITGVDIGEHSSGNEPWTNAALAAEEFLAARRRKSNAERISNEQKLRDALEAMGFPEAQGLSAGDLMSVCVDGMADFREKK